MSPFPPTFQHEQFRVMKLGNVFYSCAICRDKKNRCDGVRPICGTCKNNNKSCNYEENFSNKDQIRDFDNICNKLARIGKLFQFINVHHNTKRKRASSSSNRHEIAKRSKFFDDFNISNLETCSLDPINIDLNTVTRSIIEKVGLDTEFTDSEDVLLANIINSLSRKSLYSYILSSGHILSRIKNRSLPTYMKYSILSFGVKFLKNYKIFENHVYIRGSTYAQKALNLITSANTQINADIVFSLLLLSNHYSGINKTYLSTSLLCTVFTLGYIELTQLELENVLLIAG
ncbi:putative transcriptional regulatory protein [Smittium culicis]|uniref:Putative transcriptional regulatory protein n=1 Tax=Smittium culicis TaxID=133412 RepID=A0A1R1XE96_9FUNG|nr:putative transcriptional regulatory protein [Smittium culicis]